MSGARTASLPLFGAGPVTPPAADDGDTRPLDEAPPAAAPTPPAAAAEAGNLPPAPAGTGPLVAAAWPLLALLGRLRAGATARPEVLKRGCIAPIRRFEAEALQAGVAPDLVSAGRYVLCSALDEQVLGTPWGDASDWAAGTLLSLFHNETWGGEKVFVIVDLALAGGPAQRPLIELLFHILSLGFQGRYRLRRDGTAEVEALRDRLWASLRPGRGEAPAFSSAPAVRVTERRRLRGWVPVWMVATGCAIAAALIFVIYETILFGRAHDLALRLRPFLDQVR